MPAHKVSLNIVDLRITLNICASYPGLGSECIWGLVGPGSIVCHIAAGPGTSCIGCIVGSDHAERESWVAPEIDTLAQSYRMNECSAHSAVKEQLVWEEGNADFGNFDRLAVSIAGSGSQSCMRTETGLFVGKDSFVAVVAGADPAVVFVAADSVLVFVAAARLFDSMDGETGSVAGALAAVVEPAEVHPVAVAYTDLAEELPTAVALWKQRLAP